MKKTMLLIITLLAFTACTESERPAAQAKHAIDSAQEAADQTAKRAQEMVEQAQKLMDE